MMAIKKIVILCLILLLVMSLPTNSNGEMYPNRPPLPTENQIENQKVMVVVKKEIFNDFKAKINKIPEIAVHQTYQNVFYGFSIEGPKDKLQALKEDPAVIHSSPIVSYAPHISESVPFIGGDDVR